jgi:hypothetical protein
LRELYLVQWTSDAEAALLEDVGVDHRGFEVVMPEESLDRPNIGASLQEVGRKRMAKRVEGDAFGDAGLKHGRFDRAGYDAGVDVMAARDAGERVDAAVSGGKDVLPGSFSAGVRVFPGECVGQIDFAKAEGQVVAVEG